MMLLFIANLKCMQLDTILTSYAPFCITLQNNAVTSFTFEVFAYYSSVGPAGERVSFQCTFKV